MRVVVTGGSGFIGTNVIDYLVKTGACVLNIDFVQPRDSSQETLWRRVDVTDSKAVLRELSEFQPSHVLHLAARTDLLETRNLGGYQANIKGVANIIDALGQMRGLERVVFASSMLVCRNGYTPVSDTDYCPNTLYGTSKAEGERLVRNNTSLPWVIVRPTSIWGPWFGEPYRSFFAAVFAGRYVHPGKTVVYKALGFVGNVVHQLAQLLGADLRSVHRQTFYLCDSPHYSVRDWAESVAKIANVGAIRTVPSSILQLAAWCGDFAKVVGYKNPPLTSFRLRNMLTPSGFDVSSLLAVAGQAPYSMEEGVDLTVRWMRKSTIGRSVS